MSFRCLPPNTAALSDHWFTGILKSLNMIPAKSLVSSSATRRRGSSKSFDLPGASTDAVAGCENPQPGQVGKPSFSLRKNTTKTSIFVIVQLKIEEK
jgi:hypothetical protein